jgi:L-lactate dehydrogenase (cytochrome)
LAAASLDDYRELARKRLPRLMFDTVEGGSFGELTLAANQNDLRSLAMWAVFFISARTSVTSVNINQGF